MHIIFTLDTEDGLDPNEPLGTFQLIGEDGSKIEDELVFLDSIFLSLGIGLIEIEKALSFSSDIFDEPNPFNFRKVNHAYEIEYMDQKVTFSSLNQARKELVEKIFELKSAYSKPNSPEYNSLFEELDAITKKLNNKL